MRSSPIGHSIALGARLIADELVERLALMPNLAVVATMIVLALVGTWRRAWRLAMGRAAS